MKLKKRGFDLFNVSFLDVISCGFGAVVLLVLISRNAEAPSSDESAIAQQLLTQVMAAEERINNLASDLEDSEKDNETKARLVARLRQAADELDQALSEGQQDLEQMSGDLQGLVLVEKSLRRAAIKPATATERDEEVGGIPVDSDYVVFIIDTSGSMRQIWSRVVRELENVINIHPKIKGFQVINDNGSHLISGYAGRWIPDTPGRRSATIKLLQSWNSASNSSPVEGLEVALKRYVKTGDKVSIYIFGDDYSGGSFDPVIQTLDRLNANRVTGEPRARVHAIGFISLSMREPFSTLMREVTRRNNGSFVALPIQ